jgi:hypothetical protein
MTRIVGAPKSRRRRWTMLVPFLAAAIAAVFYVAGAGAVLTGSPSSFEAQDGDMVAANSGGTHDWANVSFDHVSDLASTQDDTSFVSGQKQDTICPDTYLHGNPPKDDFTDVASFSETNNNASSPQFQHTYLYGATIRYAANGNASENVELKKGHIDPNTGQLATCGNGLLARTAGDKLLAFDYLNGGTNLDLHVLTWIDANNTTAGGNSGICFVSGDPLPCWGAFVLHPSATSFEGKASQAAITAANNPIGSVALVSGQFAEFGVDLATTQIIPVGTCQAFPQTVWGSRSSGSSFVSTTKDLSIENHTISNCGELIIKKRTAPNRGDNHDFKYDSTIPNPSGTVTTDSSPYCQADTLPNGAYTGSGNGGFKLNDNGNTTADSAANTEDCANLQTGTYLVTEQSDSSYTLTNIVCSVTGTGGSTGKVGVITNGTFANGGNDTFDIGDRSIQASVKAGDVVTCIYTNTLNQGALVIQKNSTKSGTAVLNAGATFCYSTTSGCTTANVTDTTDSTGGDSDTGIGTVCVTGLTPGSYYVNEISAPTGYGLVTSGQANKTVTVVTGTNCSNNKPSSNATGVVSFTDPPLADVQINFRDGGSGETALDVPMTCSASNSTGMDASSTAPTGWDDSDTITGVQAGSSVVTVTCTAKIDP